MYSKELIDRIKSSVDIVEVIGEYQSLTKRGRTYIGICPFHADSTPSLTVNRERQIYKCFACGAGGDVIEYVRHAEGCTFMEALRLLARRAHIDMPEQLEETEEERRERMEREAIKRKNQESQATYIEGRANPAYQRYIENRHISAEAANVFCLGFAVKGEFAGRVTYPIYSLGGVIAGWTGRITEQPCTAADALEATKAVPEPSAEKKRQVAKYKNSAESVLFKKDELLFGLQQAKSEIQRSGKAYIVEGQNDVIRMWMSGFMNTVAGSGTAFSEKQAHLLQRFTQDVVLMYDGDAAGRKATLRTMKILLGMGFTVRVCKVPDGQDPDSWLLAAGGGEENLDLKLLLHNATRKWDRYLQEVYAWSEDADETARNAKAVSEFVAAVPNRIVRRQMVTALALYYHTDSGEIAQMVNLARIKSGARRVSAEEPSSQAVASDDWQQGLYGLEDAAAMAEKSGIKMLYLTFSKDTFVEHIDDAEPWALWQGEPAPAQVQQLRGWEKLLVREEDITAETEESGLVLRMLHSDGQHVIVLRGDEEEQWTYTDWFLEGKSSLLEDEGLDSSKRTFIIRECMNVIADTEATEREVNRKEYQTKLRLQASSYKPLLQELLAARKDKREAERKRANIEERTAGISLFELPDYVEENELMKKQYEQYGFYPLLSSGENPRPVAYVFKNEKGDGHSVVSDFYMEALLFVDPATDHSKRVIRLNHLHGTQQYVEWPSDVFVSLADIKKRLFSSGAYNFNGTPVQWDRIRQLLSYNFTDCFEARVFGWQPEGFLMLPNAVYYPEESESRDPNAGSGWRLQYMDNLGVAEVNGVRFYSPAASSIRLGGRKEDNPYEQDELAYYLEPAGKDRIDFRTWAEMMDRVFRVNDNGKWAVMFAIACNFRDFIYSVVGNFTALCFAGPTGAGKTEVAYAIRGLWMRRKASVFNLNSGTDAAFFMMLEHFRNMPVIMEEYNDNGISAQKFQGLKAAVYDDQGRVKVKDMASKTTDSSKTNAAPILLGQDTPQQDDGSLSNRVIICEVPRKETGFTPAETEEFERLKRQSELGLGNVLCEIVRQRPVFERHYRTVYFEEVQRLKRDTWELTTNKEGLERVIRSVAIMSATARLTEEYGTIQLPWRYSEFYKLATDKISRQMESISTTSKLGKFFAALNVLLGNRKILIGKELKVVKVKEPTVRVKDGTGVKDVEVGIDSKILYIHFDGCYSAYCKEVTRDALTKQTLTNYFRSNSSYIGLVKTMYFSWMEEEWAAGGTKEDGSAYAAKEMVCKSFRSSAYAFKYEVVQELFDVDFERESAGEDESETAQRTPIVQGAIDYPEDSPL